MHFAHEAEPTNTKNQENNNSYLTLLTSVFNDNKYLEVGELSGIWMAIPVSQVVRASDSNNIWLVLIKNNNNKKGLRINNIGENQYVT